MCVKDEFKNLNISEIPRTMKIVFNPQKGQGWSETLLASVLLIIFGIAMFVKHDEVLSQALIYFLTLALGYYFGQKVTKYKRRNINKK